jgi:hypothetical protein
MASTFSAGPQAVGYLHQVRYALYTLLCDSDEGASVVIEGLDDIEVSGSLGLVRLEQLKHHIKGKALLTNSSSDLWKTIRIWSVQMKDGMWNPSVTRLHLVTTTQAAKGTAAWFLKAHNDRDEAKAHELLRDVISSSQTRTKALRDAFDAFGRLSEREQMNMLRAVTIFDDAHPITELPDLIKREMRFAAPPSESILDQLYHEIEGWWFGQAVNHLTNCSREPITLIQLRKKLWTITEKLHEDNLPIHFAEQWPDTIIDPIQDERIFVQQLRCLDVNRERIEYALLDHYRAYEQRSRWVRDQLLVDDEIIHYERKLIDAWLQHRLELLDEIPDINQVSEDQCKSVGRQIFNQTQRADVRIRRNVDEQFVIRGSYHMLADTNPPRVYWHPKFLEQVEDE